VLVELLGDACGAHGGLTVYPARAARLRRTGCVAECRALDGVLLLLAADERLAQLNEGDEEPAGEHHALPGTRTSGPAPGPAASFTQRRLPGGLPLGGEFFDQLAQMGAGEARRAGWEQAARAQPVFTDC
jgi:hypothetical protein